METEEIQLIDNTFTSLKTKILDFFSIKKNLDKSDIYRELLLYQSYHQIFRDTSLEIKALPLDKYVLDKIEDLILEAEQEITIKKPSKPISLGFASARKHFWVQIKSVLLETSKEISNEIYDEILKEDLPLDGISLNRAQISLLMLYLRDKKAIKYFNDIQLALHFHTLTPYSYKQLRLLIVSHAKSEKNLITEKKDDYINLKNLLLSIVSDIESDMKKAVLK